MVRLRRLEFGPRLSFCNVLHIWTIWAIPESTDSMILYMYTSLNFLSKHRHHTLANEGFLLRPLLNYGTAILQYKYQVGMDCIELPLCSLLFLSETCTLHSGSL